ncbi:MAG: LON peptidase substrate-binding domain-containing protein [Planctomycetota bacterium]
MDPEQLVVNFNKPIKLFPLQSCVLLPHVTVPLHVFESRYRALLRDALDSDGLIGMAVFEGDAWKQDYEGNPPLRPCVAVGYLAKDQRLDDGRHNILLHGVCRARIEEELPLHPDGYRLAQLQPFGHEIDGEAQDELELHRPSLTELLEDPQLSRLPIVDSLKEWFTEETPVEVFVELASLALIQDVEERYSVLAEGDVLKRATAVEHKFEAMRDLAERSQNDSEPRDEEGWPLN